MKKILVFDLDGTLLDSLADIRHALNTALGEHGLPPHDSESVRGMVGHGLPELIKLAVGPAAAQAEAVLARMRQIYREIPFRLTRPYPGIPELLDELHAGGAILAVLTNKAEPIAQIIIDHFFPGRFALVQGEMPQQPRKPHPDALLSLLKRLAPRAGIDPQDQTAWCGQAIMIGDGETDIHTAAAAGVRAIGVGWGFRSPAQLMAAGANELVADVPALRVALGLDGSGPQV